MKKYLLILALTFFYGCNKTKSNSKDFAKISDSTAVQSQTSPNEKTFEMYTMTELASLMEKMYADQSRIKSNINKGIDIGKYNSYIEKIKFAKMTEPSDDDAFYQKSADQFILGQKRLFEDSDNVKANFNKGIDLCIQCHQQKCLGPISRIKKLYLTK